MALMFVVARDSVDLWDQLSHEFAGRDVRIVLDRRRGDEQPAHGHHRPERRRRPDVDEELRHRGFATVSLDGPPRRLTAAVRAPRADSRVALAARPGIR